MGRQATYGTAYEQIRVLLASRSQAEPILQAKHVSDELTCWPVPPLATIRRYMHRVRSEPANVRHEQKTPRAA